MTVLSFVQAKEILAAVDRGETRLRLLLDLGLNPGSVEINHKFREIRFQDASISFADLETIAHDDSVCYFLEKKRHQKLKMFSAETNLFYKIVPSKDAPTLEISGIRMHRTQERTPWQDTLDKIASLKPLKGHVLDTCCCFGYTAIAAAKETGVVRVFTFERDSNVLELADYNPWSKDLYTDRKIKLTVGDVFVGLENFSAGFFDAVIHDPPRFALSPQLYSLDFYKQLFRVMKPNARLFHYTGNPGGKSGKDIVRGVIARLREAGFVNVRQRSDILGVTGEK